MKNNKLNPWIIILILCNLFLFTACSTDTKNSQEAAAIANTVIADITETAQSSSTPTDESTALPNATSTPRFNKKDVVVVPELEYISVEKEKMSRCTSALDALLVRFNDLSDDLSLLLDPTYLDKFNVEIDDFETYCTNLGQINPPATMEAVNKYLLLASQEYQQSADDLRYGVNNLNADHLNSSAEHLTNGADYLHLSTVELNTIANPYESD